MRGVAVISALVPVNMRMGRISFMVGLRVDINQVIARVLQQLILGQRAELDFRINGRGMFHAWLERRTGVLMTARRLRERAAHAEVVIR